MMEIDFVLPWVDPSDEAWIDSFKVHATSNEVPIGSARFRDLGTLKYVLRSIEKFCPWYNRIILLTQGHTPKWINLAHPKIKIIRHEDFYFDKSHLPTFNSSSIEMNLPNIKDLSQYFVYLNDDTFITKDTSLERFFIDGKPIDFFSHGWFSRGKIYELVRGKDVWVNSIKNNIKLINSIDAYNKVSKRSLYHDTYGNKNILSNILLGKLYKEIFWFEHWHHPQPYCKQTLLDVYRSFSVQMSASSSNKFRRDNDLTHYLYRYWHLVHNDFVPTKYHDGSVISLKNKKSIAIFKKELLKGQSRFLCLNDGKSDIGDAEFKVFQLEVNNILEKFFYEKASFEL